MQPSNQICFLNGQYLPITRAAISVNDLSVQRGYGIFDFLRVVGQQPLYLADHLDRFFRSAKEMRLEQGLDREEVTEIIFHLIHENRLAYSGIRLLLTGGSSPDGFQILRPSLAIVQKELAPPPDTLLYQGYQLVSYPHQRQLPHIKTIDYLMAIWLQPWIREQGADDVLYHQAGRVLELPRSNIFIITRSGILQTPGDQVLHGVTRKQILELAAAMGIPVAETDITMDAIRDAREVFISSSTKRILPVVKVDGFELGPYTKDSIAAKLFEALKEKEQKSL
ncbi:MAG: aminotransferase class IV [Bacteroidota bacterium]|nr:aminotransferase class IV [Bacteroidota bacterium]